MIIEKLLWVSHPGEQSEACAIYSVDVHPEGSRFATGGGDNTVRVWSTEGLCEDSDEEEEEDENGESAAWDAADVLASSAAQLLAVLANHTQAVNCVRWSNHGRFLVSGSDDQLLMIWELKTGEVSTVPFGSTALPNKENWSRVFTLKGHTMDVLDVAWSPDDSMIASCSIDNSVLVWRLPSRTNRHSGHVLTAFQTLNHHTSWVKGVCWDPVGKYLASSSEDGSLAVWKAAGTWGVEENIRAPFARENAAQTFFRRVSWSTDGGYICATNAVKRGLHTACLVSRGAWDKGVDLVGHSDPVVASRFNPRLLVKGPADALSASKNNYYACVALGGQDATVSIWITAQERPVAILRDCFDKAVTDLAWNRGGGFLLASSFDGTVCAFKFEESEIGSSLPKKQHKKYLEKTYGVTLKGWIGDQHKNSFDDSQEEAPLLEDPLLLSMDSGKVGVKRPYAQITKAAQPPQPQHSRLIRAPSQPTQQVESRTSNGKKRIRPVLVTQPLASAESQQGTSMTLHSQSPQASELALPTCIDAPISPQVPQPHITGALKLADSIADVSSIVLAKADHQGVLSLRIPNKGEESSLYVEVSVLQDTNKSGQPSASLSRLCLSQGGKELWRSIFAAKASAICGNDQVVAIGTLNGTINLWSTTSGMRMCPQITVGDPIAFLRCPAANKDENPHDIKNDKLFLLAVTIHGWVQVWDLLKMKMIVKETLQPVVRNIHLSAQMDKDTENGSSNASAEPKSNGDVKIIDCLVQSNGFPMVVLERSDIDDASQRSFRQGFVFNREMATWMRLDDGMHTHSELFRLLPTHGSLSESSPSLQQIQARCRQRAHRSARLLLDEDDDTLTEQATITHIEDQIASALALNSLREFKQWLGIYAKYLADRNDQKRLRMLCEKFLSRARRQTLLPHSGSDSDDEDSDEDDSSTSCIAWWAGLNEELPTDTAIDSQKMLEEVVFPAIASNKELQRLILEYKESLELSSNLGQA